MKIGKTASLQLQTKSIKIAMIQSLSKYNNTLSSLFYKKKMAAFMLIDDIQLGAHTLTDKL